MIAKAAATAALAAGCAAITLAFFTFFGWTADVDDDWTGVETGFWLGVMLMFFCVWLAALFAVFELGRRVWRRP